MSIRPFCDPPKAPATRDSTFPEGPPALHDQVDHRVQLFVPLQLRVALLFRIWATLHNAQDTNVKGMSRFLEEVILLDESDERWCWEHACRVDETSRDLSWRGIDGAC